MADFGQFGLSARITGDPRDFVRGLQEADRALDQYVQQTERADRATQLLGRAAAAVGVTLGGAGLVRAVGQLESAGHELEATLARVRRSTGATGEQFAELQKIVSEISRTVPDSIGTVGDAVSELHRRLGLTGDELEQTARKVLDYARINDQQAGPAVRDLARLLEATETPASELSGLMDKLTFASQRSGIGVDTLAQAVTAGGIALTELGFSVDRSIALFSRFERVGARPVDVLSSLNIAMTNLAREGFTDAEAAFDELLARIRNAPDELTAVTIAADAFGSRVGAALAEEIRGGTFEVDEFVEALQRAEGTVDRTARESVTAAQRIETSWNRIRTDAIDPLGEAIANIRADALEALADNLVLVQDVALATAAVVGGRFLGSLVRAADAKLLLIQQSRAAAVATAEETAALVQSTRATLANASASVAAAKERLAFALNMGVGSVAAREQLAALSALSAATKVEAAATAQAAAAEQLHAQALARTSVAAHAKKVAMGDLNRAMAFLGGPWGLILTAIAAGFVLIRRRARETTEALEEQRDVAREIAQAIGALSREEAERTAAAASAAAASTREQIQQLKAQREAAELMGQGMTLAADATRVASAALQGHGQAAEGAGKSVDELDAEIAQLEAQLAGQEAIARRAREQLFAYDRAARDATDGTRGLTDAEKRALERSTERMAALRIQVEEETRLLAARKAGEAAYEAELAAITRERAVREAAANVVAQHREEAARLAEELVDLAEAQRALERAEAEAAFVRELQDAQRAAEMLAEAHREGEDAVREVNIQLEVTRLHQRALEEGWALTRDEIERIVRATEEARQAAERYRRDRERQQAEEEQRAKATQAVWEEAARGIQQSLAGAIDDVLAGGIDGFQDFSDSVLEIFRRLAAQITAAMLAEQLGLTQIVDDMRRAAERGRTGEGGGVVTLPRGVATVGAAGLGAMAGWQSGSAGVGGVTGGLGAAAMGAGPWGMAAAAIAGVAGGLLGAGRAAAEAERELERAERAFQGAIRTLEQIATPLSALDAALQRVGDAADAALATLEARTGVSLRADAARDPDALRAQADRAERTAREMMRSGMPQEIREAGEQLQRFAEGLREIAEQAERAAEAERARHEALVRRTMEDLEVRALIAQGRHAEAEALRIALEQQRELDEAIDDTVRARLEEIHALEDVQRAAEAAAAAAQRLTDFMQDLVLLEADVAGDEVAQVRARIEADNAARLAAAREMLEAGEITEELFERLAAALDERLNKAIAEVLERQAQRIADFTRDLEMLEAENAGDVEAQIRLRHQADADARLDAARRMLEAGEITQEMFDRLEEALGIRLANALAEAAAAADEAAAAHERAVAAIEEDIEIQLLEAQGRTEEAERRRLEIRQREQLERLLDQGATERTLEMLQELFDLQWQELAERFAGMDATDERSRAAASRTTGVATQDVLRATETSVLTTNDLLRQSNYWLQEIATYTRRISESAQATTAAAAPMVTATVGTAVSGRAALSVSVHQTFYAPITTTSTTEFAQRNAREIAALVNRELAKERERDRAFGTGT